MGVRTKTRELLTRIINRKHFDECFVQWESLYGDFDKSNYTEFTINNLPNESRLCHGEIIKWSSDISPKRVLLAGDNISAAARLKNIINAGEVLTAGLSNADYIWNFEQDVPAIPCKFDLIVSQAIFEHLMNPYKHLQDLSKLLQIKGHIIIHTVMPGFQYHRYPIDSFRFFPDWFEECAKRFDLIVIKRRIKGTHIFYMYQKK